MEIEQQVRQSQLVQVTQLSKDLKSEISKDTVSLPKTQILVSSISLSVATTYMISTGSKSMDNGNIHQV